MLFQRDNEGSVNGEIVRREKPLMVTNKVSVVGGERVGRSFRESRRGWGISVTSPQSRFFHDIKENQIGNTQNTQNVKIPQRTSPNVYS